MNKKRLCLIITGVGILLIIIFSVIFAIMDEGESKEIKYLKKNLVSKALKCIKDNNCEKKSITLNELNSKGYLDDKTLKELDGYSLDSIISYPVREINLIKNEK